MSAGRMMWRCGTGGDGFLIHAKTGQRAMSIVRPLSLGLLFFLVMVLASNALSEPAQARTFTDVAGDEYFALALDALSEMGVVEGRPDGSFGPDEPVTRGQLAALLSRALGLPQSTIVPFVDLDSTHWAYGYVAALYWAGLVSGDEQRRFMADAHVSRQQAASMVVSALAYRSLEDPYTAADLSDESDPTAPWLAAFRDRMLVADVHARAVADAYRLGIMTGSSDGWLYPELPLSRAQMAAILYRAFYQPSMPREDYPGEVPMEWYPEVSSGSSGPVVKILEARLTLLGYPCGPQDGTYDYRTKDGVMAFQKVERLGRDGIAGLAVWERLFSTTTPAPRLDKPGRRAEVDLARQVLFMIEDNRVVKVVHVSTGKNGTPTGHGEVYHKDLGWVHVPVGWMYSPSYIMPHIAIHGSRSVPPYPASHGCVRTPMWVSDDMYRELPLGLSVDVYY